MKVKGSVQQICDEYTAGKGDQITEIELDWDNSPGNDCTDKTGSVSIESPLWRTFFSNLDKHYLSLTKITVNFPDSPQNSCHVAFNFFTHQLASNIANLFFLEELDFSNVNSESIIALIQNFGDISFPSSLKKIKVPKEVNLKQVVLTNPHLCVLIFPLSKGSMLIKSQGVPVKAIPIDIEVGLSRIDNYKRVFEQLPETSLKYYYEQVFNAFNAAYVECANEYNADSYDLEKINDLQKKIRLLECYMGKFREILNTLFEIEEVIQLSEVSFDITRLQLKSAFDIKIEDVTEQANELINAVEMNEHHGLAVSIANFITKTLLAIGVPVAATGVGAYVGGVIGGVLGLSTVTFTGPAGLIVGASLGAWIGGGAGFVTGTAGGVYASSKFTFFSPMQISLTAFAKQAIDYAEESKTVASLKVAAAAA